MRGVRHMPYADTVGRITIGWGRNLTDCGISDNEAMHLLKDDIDEVLADLATFPWFAGLDEVRSRAIANFRFNVGPKTFRDFEPTWERVAAGDFAGVAAHLRDSKWAGQVKVRAVLIIQMLETGRDPILFA